MPKEIVYTKNAPEPIGPYNQAIKHQGIIYVSGQIALDPKGILHNATIEEETHQVISNLKAILIAGGSSLDQVIKCSIFLTDMDSFGKINTIYGQYFGTNSPARETVEVSRLPKNVSIEISCIAQV